MIVVGVVVIGIENKMYWQVQPWCPMQKFHCMVMKVYDSPWLVSVLVLMRMYCRYCSFLQVYCLTLLRIGYYHIGYHWYERME